MRYLVEVSPNPIIPVTVEANTEQEAIEQVLKQNGEAGDTYYAEPTFKVKPLED